MPTKKKPGPPTPRNPVARTAPKFNKAAVHTDKKKEQKKTGRSGGKQPDATPDV